VDKICMPFILVHVRIFISEEYGLLGCNCVKFGESSTFRRNIYPQSSGSKGKQGTRRSRRQVEFTANNYNVPHPRITKS
jgi:hypothetical protein